MQFPNMPLWLLSVVVHLLLGLRNPWVLAIMAVGLVDIATTIYAFLHFPTTIAERFVITRWLINHLGVIGGCVAVRVLAFGLLCAFPLTGDFARMFYIGQVGMYLYWAGNNLYVLHRASLAELAK